MGYSSPCRGGDRACSVETTVEQQALSTRIAKSPPWTWLVSSVLIFFGFYGILSCLAVRYGHKGPGLAMPSVVLQPYDCESVQLGDVSIQEQQVARMASNCKSIGRSQPSCEANNLGLVDTPHIVVACEDLFDNVAQWVAALGWTNSKVFVYTRIPRAENDSVRSLPCGVQLHHKVLLPNQGNEAAVYLHHILEHYGSLPKVLLFGHCHGPLSWHTMPDPFVRRARAVYRGIQEQQQESWLREFSKMMVTLSAGCPGPAKKSAAACRNTLLCNHLHNEHLQVPGPLDWDWMHQRCIRSSNGAAVEWAPYTRFTQEQVVEAACTAANTSCVGKKTTARRPAGEGKVSNDACHKVLDRLGISRPYWSNKRFWSCCSSFIVPRSRIEMRDVHFYQQLLDFLLDTRYDDYYTGRDCMEHAAWEIWAATSPSNDELDHYLKVDDLFSDEYIQPWW